MDKEFELLSRLPFFQDIPRGELESSSLLWTVRELSAGTHLWWQGQPPEEFAFLCSGRLTVHIADEDIAEITVDEMLGEAAVFTGEPRSASVSALENSTLLTLSMSHLDTLRGTHPSIYNLILNRCLQRMSTRVQEMGLEIARLGKGSDKAPTRKQESTIGRLWKRLTGTKNMIPPSAESSLRKLPKLKEASKDILIQIMSAMTPHNVEKGEPIFLQGDPGDSVFLLASGSINVVRNVRGGNGEVLATLYSGALFGTGSLLLRERRNASCVADKSADCWVYEMNLEAHRSLKGEASLLWKESLISALAFQVRSAAQQIVALKVGKPSETDYDKLKAGLEGFQGK